VAEPVDVEFLVEQPPEGGYVARSTCGCVFTQAATLEELYRNVKEAACCQCDEAAQPETIRLRFVKVVREETIRP
jgi:hypothetical protein